MPTNDEKTAGMISSAMIKSAEETDDILYEISDSLDEISKGQKVLSDLAKEEKIQKLKEKTGDMKNDQPAVVEQGDDLEAEKQLGFIRKTFNEGFGSIKSFLSPGGMLKTFGLTTGSPIFMLLGDKLDSLIDNYKEFSKESDIDRNKLINQQEESSKNDFLKEQQRDEELQIAEKTNDLLEEIRDKEPEKNDKSGLMEMIKAPLAMFSKFLPKSLVTAFASGGMIKAFKGLFGKGMLGLGGKLLKGGGKLLGKLALPLALISGGVDFFSGFKNAEEITGKTGIGAQIQGGISEMLSGFTFGLLDAKTISKGVDMVVDKVKEIFSKPIEYIKELWSGERDFLNDISTFLDTISFGLIGKDTIKEGIDILIDKFKNFFYAPIKLVQDIWNGEQSITDSISDYLENITFGFLSKDKLVDVINFFGEKIKSIFFSPIKMIQNIWNGETSILDLISQYYSSISFGLFTPEDIKNGIISVSEKIKGFFIEPFNILKSLWENTKTNVMNEIQRIGDVGQGIVDSVVSTYDNITDSITGVVEDIISAFVDRAVGLKEKIGEITDMIKNPIDTLRSLIFDDEDEIDINTKKGDEVDVTKYLTNTKPSRHEEERLRTIQKQSTVLERVRMEKDRQRRADIERKASTEDQRETKQNNLLQNNFNNHIYPQDDMTTKTDDQNWSMFQLAY